MLYCVDKCDGPDLGVKRIRPWQKIPNLVQEWVKNDGREMTCAINTMNATDGMILFYIFGSGRQNQLCG